MKNKKVIKTKNKQIKSIKLRSNHKNHLIMKAIQFRRALALQMVQKFSWFYNSHLKKQISHQSNKWTDLWHPHFKLIILLNKNNINQQQSSFVSKWTPNIWKTTKKKTLRNSRKNLNKGLSRKTKNWSKCLRQIICD